MRRLIWIHPLFFAWFAPMALLSHNIEGAPPYLAVRTFLAVTIIALGLVLLFKGTGSTWADSAFLSSLALMGSSVYGNLIQLAGVPSAGPQAARVHLFGIVVFIAFMALCRWLVRRTGRVGPGFHAFLAMVGGLSLAWNGIRVVMYEQLISRPLALPSMTADLGRYRPAHIPLETPDIYYIILDGYGRDDVLERIYGLDNSAFLQRLQDWGFFVPRDAVSNYAQTSLSLASSMNMSYLDDLEAFAGVGIPQSEVPRLFRHNEVVRVLRSWGYSIVAITIPYNRTRMPTADLSFEPVPQALNSFESLFVETSFLWSPLVIARETVTPFPFPGYAGRRETILANFSTLMEAIDLPGPKIVFAHLSVPHPPFIFGATGDPTSSPFPYRDQDGDQFLGTTQDYLKGYADQVWFANQLAIAFLDELDAQGRSHDIVILQGDHGPGSRLDWLDAGGSDLWERHSILNALRIPGLADGILDDSLSPVNTFRIIFNHLSGSSYPRLPDMSYFSSWKTPYSFLAVPGPDLRRK